MNLILKVQNIDVELSVVEEESMSPPRDIKCLDDAGASLGWLFICEADLNVVHQYSIKMNSIFQTI